MKRKKQRKKKIKKSLKKFGSLKKVFTFTTSNKENEKRVSIKNRVMKTYKNNNRILSVECEDGVYTLHIGEDCILETMNTYTLEEYIDNFLAPIK
jgi:hypothetical protein